jgi:DNA-nicking Smr family endonuclease
MDFGDILDKWEKEGRKNQGKQPVSTQDTAENRPVKIDPLSEWIRKNGVIDKDGGDEENFGEIAAEKRRRLRKKRPDAVIDIHGLTREEAWSALEGFFENGRQQGFEKLAVIHGKGNHSKGDAVLREMTRDFIERCSFAGENGHGDAATGGSGMTWVLLK